MVFTPPSVPLLGDRNLPYLFSKTYPSFLTIKEGSTFLTKPLFNSLYDPFGSPHRGQKPFSDGKDVTALQC